ncbi:hypothetical protein FOA43_004494 [Brettanomyces nanus]|uniref:Probable metalloprotease ARX1 n=1 Tax=Eeniella nana TaxID=13502 RepID=A0A875S870_EENNA|nr:uncharacterized protein FOA43_004494 [Brettanomyces nanus]QPG77093.1 hypothetical protein FOA43_004494 [Brettanomyces nanus]
MMSNREEDVLLKQKNVLNPLVLDKYRFAGQVTQSSLKYLTSLINDSYHLGNHTPYTAAELCILGDSYIQAAVNEMSPKDVKEKGIAQPVTIDVNDLVEGYSPEFDDKTNLSFQPGDIVTINLGCQVDGYTSRLAHTLVIYPVGPQPAGPLLGGPADAICASHIATETVIALLVCSLFPERLPRSVAPVGSQVTGSLIREVVDSIAETFHCTIVPGSKVRRIRRFLAGQAEGVVAERDFKGVVWSEADQELNLLRKSGKFDESSSQLVKYRNGSVSEADDNASTVPKDEFVVIPGEVYTIDIRMAPTGAAGLVTLEVLDEYSGKNCAEGEMNPKPRVFLRDVAMTYQLRLKSARKLLSNIDRRHPVYPFKLSETSSHFPLDISDTETLPDQVKSVNDDIKLARLGMSELTNQRLTVAKPIWAARFIPLRTVLKATSSTGIHGIDAQNPTLPGLELPLPKLGITALKLKSMLKRSSKIPVARELSTVVLDNVENRVVRLSGGDCNPSWVHSNYELQGDMAQGVNDLIQLCQNGVNIIQCQPLERL